MRLCRPAAAAGLLAITLGASSLANAQTAQNTQNAQSGAAPEDVVVARIDEDAVYLSDLEIERLGLPEQYRTIPLQQIYPQLVARVVERRLMAREAEKEGLADDPNVARLLRRAREALRFRLPRAAGAGRTDAHVPRAGLLLGGAKRKRSGFLRARGT